jgi:hypothetical protein
VKSGKLKTVGGDSALATSCERALVMGMYHEIYHPVTVLDSSKSERQLMPSFHVDPTIHP